MKVAYFGTAERGGGIANYEAELLNNLQEIDNLNITTVDMSTYPQNILEKFFALRRDVAKYSKTCDIVHLPAQFQAASLIGLQTDCPVVITVHDLIPLVSPYGTIIQDLLMRAHVRGLKYSDQMIAISEYTKQDVLDVLSVPEDSINVVYPAIDKSTYDTVASKEQLSTIGVTDPYLLYVGTQYKRKNLRIVLEALALLDIDDLQLVIAGKPGRRRADLRTKYYIRKYDLQDKVRVVGFVDTDMLARLYKSTIGFVFPSKYEGFGRPALEAMSMGAPTISTDATAVPEVVGDGALLCDPDDTGEWADAIQSVYWNQERQAEYSRRGRERAEEFDWMQTAKETMKLYREHYQKQ